MSDDSKNFEDTMAREAAMGNSPPPSTEPNCRNKFDEEVEAVILFPSLGAPQILPSDATECTIIIATNTQGSQILSNPCKGAVAVNHHLRLTNLYADKSKFQVDVKDHRLYGALDDKLAKGDEASEPENSNKAKEYIAVWPLSLDAQSGILKRPVKPPESEQHTPKQLDKVIGCLSFEARELYGEFNQYFAITLKQLNSMHSPPSADPRSWYWIVSANHDRIQEDKQCEQPVLTKEKQLYQPGDRLLTSKLMELGVNVISTRGFLIGEKELFEVSSIDEYGGPRTDKGFLRVQLWHPVMTIPAGGALKLGHLTDTHINVRQASLARSQARVIESPEAGGKQNEPIGPRVAHASQAFKTLIDKMEGKVDFLLLTGDYIDFNRNLQPSATAGLNIGQLWEKFNVFTNALKPNGIYRRGLDYVYLYSLLLYALRDKKLPAFMVTGNHEGYQLPYGISPRVNSSAMSAISTTLRHSAASNNSWGNESGDVPQTSQGDGKVHPYEGGRSISNFSAALKVYVEREKEAYDALRVADADHAAKPTATTEAEREKALQCHNDTVRQLRELHEKSVELASQYHNRKATECIPSDHNLTIYEACLAFGPTYGQTLTTHNFRHHQLDFMHWLFTPFSDLNVYPGCSDLLGYGAKYAITLLGWGPDERLLATSTGEVIQKSVARWSAKGKDQRGPGFLPYALTSISPAQIEVLRFASHAICHEKQETCSLDPESPAPVPGNPNSKWIVASHFTVASYEDNIPVGAVGGFVPDDKPKTAFWFHSEIGAQYSDFTWGGCELGLQTYLSLYTSSGSVLPGRVNMHFSGHSHRAGVYTLARRGNAVRITCRVPGMPGDLGQLQSADTGTRFIVGSTAGPMGKQALDGYRQEAGIPMKDCFTDTEKRWGCWNSFLSGWLTRPPSGLIADPKSGEVEYIVTADEARNQKPRLAVMLDYRHLLSDIKPIDIYPGNFDKGFAVRLSDEVEAMQCFKLDDVVLWVFKEGETKEGQHGSNRDVVESKPTAAKKPTGQWQKFAASLAPDLQRPGHYTLRLQTPNAVRNALKVISGGGLRQKSERPSVDQSSDLAITREMAPQYGSPGFDQSSDVAITREMAPQGFDPLSDETRLSIAAFLGIGLTTPQAPESAPWSEVRCDEHWIFPVCVQRVVTPATLDIYGHTQESAILEQIFRDEGELGEVPNWLFLSTYFGDKGYIDPEDAIKSKKLTGNTDHV